MKVVTAAVLLLVILTAILASAWLFWLPPDTDEAFAKRTANADTPNSTEATAPSVPVNTSIDQETELFIRQQLPLVRDIYPVWQNPENEVQFFSVLFLGPDKFLEGSASAYALTLTHRTKVGWVWIYVPEGFRRTGYSVNETQLNFYDIDATDANLYSKEFLDLIPATSWRDYYFIFLSKDPDTSREGLLEIALLLQEGRLPGSKFVALELLENKKVQADREILQVITKIPDPPYTEHVLKAKMLLKQLTEATAA